MNKRPEEPRSLLRRLLKQADDPNATVGAPPPSTEIPMPPPTPPAPREASPIRPVAPVSDTIVPEPLKPIAPHTDLTPQQSAIPQVLTTPEQRLQAEVALETLRQKTAQVANEFANGKINRAQFSSMYAYYNEKRVIIEQLLMRDPGTQAWQQVARPGHTTFLRQHFEARVMAFAVYDIGKLEPITEQGTQPIPSDGVQRILTALYIVMRNRKDLNPVSRRVEGGGWLTIVPGVYTTAVALFSLEPAARQVLLVRDLHMDFERANRNALERGIRRPEQLVFPHRALFEQHGES
jgi:hypothetical protein